MGATRGNLKAAAQRPWDLAASPLVDVVSAGLFARRPNRFVVEVEVDGRYVLAHLPNPGRLWELLLPGRRVLLAPGGDAPGRKLPYAAVAVVREGVTVPLHTQKTNDAAHFLLHRRLVPGLEGARVLKREVALGGSRFDFLLRDGRGEILLEVKSCTLFGRRLAMFPDAVTERGRRHLEVLAGAAATGLRCGVLFLVHSPRPSLFLPDYHTDFAFARAFAEYREKVFYRALCLSWTEDLRLEGVVREAAIPWDVLEGEGRDRGAYVLVLKLPQALRLRVGSLGERAFPAGWYLYVGAAAKDLSARLARHLRKGGKSRHWHIDYLREASLSCAAIPVRTADDVECDLAAAVGAIADGCVARFGSSDCSCPGHLFHMREDPLRNPAFIGVLQHFRMDRPVAAWEQGGPGR